MAEQRATEATCQGCFQCKYGGIVPCPTQTQRKTPLWVQRAKDRELRGKVLSS